MSDHNHEGNCWDEVHTCDDCGAGNMCDVCHRHCEPRGSCDKCPDCEACTIDERLSKAEALAKLGGGV
jgi:hypothetical protein